MLDDEKYPKKHEYSSFYSFLKFIRDNYKFSYPFNFVKDKWGNWKKEEYVCEQKFENYIKTEDILKELRFDKENKIELKLNKLDISEKTMK